MSDPNDDFGKATDWTAEMHVQEALCQVLDRALPEGMHDTPARVVRALAEMTAGYNEDPRAILSKEFDADGYDQVVAVTGINFVSLCEHHCLPFAGTAGVAYLPSKSVVGLSKLARVVDVFARRFQIQERMTRQIADAIEETLHPAGVAVVLQATHGCLAHRGAMKPNAVMKTSVLRGSFMDGPARQEVLALLGVA